MRLRRVEPGVNLGLRRGSAVICTPVSSTAGPFERCLDSLLTRTPTEVPVLVSDDCGPESSVLRLLVDRDEAGLLGRDVHYVRQPDGFDSVRNLNTCFDMASPADVVLLNSDREVAADWFQRLHGAAYSDTTIATAAPLTNNGSLVSVPDRNHGQPGLPPGWTLESAAAAIAEASLRLRPHLPTLVGHCAYIKRSAIDLVGGLDLEFSPGGSEEVDFSQRCLLRGLAHVAADDVFVLHHGSPEAALDPREQQIRHEHDCLIGKRYPYYYDAVIAAAASTSSPLARALSIAERALKGLSVTIDGSCFGDLVSGTQVHTLEVIDALHRVGGAHLRVAVTRACRADVRRILAELGGVELIDLDGIDGRTLPTDVVHRPYQVGRLHELQRLRRLGKRVVITQQDLISYRNPGHFDDFKEWDRYRRLARVTLAQAERTVFFSRHAACDAVTEDLVDQERSRVVYIGVDHRHHDTDGSRRPALPEGVEGHGILLCLGVDFLHKNRLFALRVLEQLQLRHRWEGHLVLAGPQASPGSSAPDDQEFLREHDSVAAVTTVLGQVTEEERRWLLANATVVISPSTYEGFGLLPFEAAEAGVPCLYAPQASLVEVLPVELALIEPWDAADTADRMAALMTDPAESRRLVESVRAAASRYRWDQTARELLTVYREAADAPSRELIVELAGGAEGQGREAQLREPTLELAKAVRYLRTYGVLKGSLRGGRAFAGRVRRRLRPGR
jgi:glycosyltransferase involved in cell wall biosynthesis